MNARLRTGLRCLLRDALHCNDFESAVWLMDRLIVMEVPHGPEG